jgi:FAD/FMN-containing dehydrogenase
VRGDMTHSILLNDVHSRLNPTGVRELLFPRSIEEVAWAVRRAAAERLAVSVCGGRHAMGGQQFATDGLQIDLGQLVQVNGFDQDREQISVGAGIQWPSLVERLDSLQRGMRAPVTFRQKQTGADRLSLGGALSANVHGRGLRYKPFVEDVETFTLVDANGDVRRCSRTENAQLFRLAIGGYGLFGVICEITLRLVPRLHLRRVVEIAALDEVEESFDRRLAEGYEYGDFQFLTDPAAPGFMNKGVLSAYLPVEQDVPVSEGALELSAAQWQQLLRLAHTDKQRAFDVYSRHYLATNGQIYRSDLQQMGVYVDGYHGQIDSAPASEMITEVYVPRKELTGFMRTCSEDFRKDSVEFIYGTIRVIEPDDETFLPWAQGNRACVIFNLHVRHDPAGLAKAQNDFRRIIDRALQRGGSFYLTYHRWATTEQVLAGHPRFVDFLKAKKTFDPGEVFQSDWYRHWRALFGQPPSAR